MLALQRDPDIFQRRQVRKHRRNLERAHEAKPRHIGRRHRRDILSLVQDLTGRRLQELGQKIEARGLAGPVRSDQRVNTATADPKIDIANGKEAREFLGQSVGFENELIGQSNFPHQPTSRCAIARGQFFLTGRSLPDVLGKSRPGPAASGREYAVNGPPIRKAAKLGVAGGDGADSPRVELPEAGSNGPRLIGRRPVASRPESRH